MALPSTKSDAPIGLTLERSDFTAAGEVFEDTDGNLYVCGSFADRLDEGHRQWLTGMRRHQRRRTVVCAAPGHKRDLTKANSPEATTGRVGPHPIRQRVGCAVASGGTHCAENGPASWRQPGRQVVA